MRHNSEHVKHESRQGSWVNCTLQFNCKQQGNNMNRVDSSTDEVTSNSLHRLHRTTSGSILIGKLFKLLAAVIYSIYSVDNITETRFFILTKQLTVNCRFSSVEPRSQIWISFKTLRLLSFPCSVHTCCLTGHDDLKPASVHTAAVNCIFNLLNIHSESLSIIWDYHRGINCTQRVNNHP